MRFPSLFRLPSHQRFNIEPRYYDPIKEEIEERTERIKREQGNKASEFMPRRISFERRSRTELNTSFLQLLIAAILGVLLIGWLYFGNQVFNVLWLVLPAYLFFRLRGIKKRN